jgi:uncharacterized membrane protein
LWFVPVLCVLAGLILSFATIWVDRAFDYEVVPPSFTGGPDAALQVLSTIAASMVSLAALVLTITMVVVQLAMGQFSPRIVQTILQDRPSQIAIGLFVATFAHSMLTLREVRTTDPVTVPGLSILVAYVLVLASIAVLVLYVNHIGRSLRVAALIELVGSDTRRLLDEQYAQPAEQAVDPRVVLAERSGVITNVDEERIVRTMQAVDGTARLQAGLGEFVPAGAVLFVVDGAACGEPTLAELRAAVHQELERTLDRDVAYGFRLLVDIAQRSVAESPFQDPTTAVQAIDRLHDCLRQLAPRRFPDGRHLDDSGRVRLTMPVMSWDDFVRLAFEEITLAGAGSPQVERRVLAAIDDLEDVATGDRFHILSEYRRRIQTRHENEERDGPVHPDAHGIGLGTHDGHTA